MCIDVVVQRLLREELPYTMKKTDFKIKQWNSVELLGLQIPEAYTQM